ncbi:hypothetical protein NQ176_g6253 [Zarea fungicola]|uniref:Uncharacterized protein n=1 Tax=Zarea fungicola TaxID=93591 RepID=A0ACC1N4N8_9HYPO|nr:hypothetical protein NQ176_g6253 [Lecanicillium fungicola]
MDMGHGSSDGVAECKISMLFNFYTVDACFLSSGWHIKNNGMFAATCIGIVLLVVLVEFCRRMGKQFDELLYRQFQRQAAIQRDALVSEGTSGDFVAAPRALTLRATPLQQLIRAVIHAITFAAAYIVMLLAMYFNVYVLISIFIGAGLGKFFCDWLVVTVDDRDEPNSEAKGIDEATVCCG